MRYLFRRTRLVYEYERCWIEAESPEAAAKAFDKIDKADGLDDLGWKQIDADVHDEWIDTYFESEGSERFNRFDFHELFDADKEAK